MRVGILAKGKEATGSVNRKNGCVTLGGVVVLVRELARQGQEDINGIRDGHDKNRGREKARGKTKRTKAEVRLNGCAPTPEPFRAYSYSLGFTGLPTVINLESVNPLQ